MPNGDIGFQEGRQRSRDRLGISAASRQANPNKYLWLCSIFTSRGWGGRESEAPSAGAPAGCLRSGAGRRGELSRYRSRARGGNGPASLRRKNPSRFNRTGEREPVPSPWQSTTIRFGLGGGRGRKDPHGRHTAEAGDGTLLSALSVCSGPVRTWVSGRRG